MLSVEDLVTSSQRHFFFNIRLRKTLKLYTNQKKKFTIMGGRYKLMKKWRGLRPQKTEW